MKFYVSANWKMNKDLDETRDFLSEISETFEPQSDKEMVFFPSFLSLNEFTKMSRPLFQYGGQNCSDQLSGAYTGEVSLPMLKSTGATYCLIGHSERRQYYGETDEAVFNKAQLASQQGLKPMVCIGETEQEREQGQTLERLAEQLKRFLSNNPIENLLIAYEPVWAIGTGKVASVTDIEDVHNFLRKQLKDQWGEAGEQVPLLYGGSVKPGNASEIGQIENVNGFLIGGASLQVESLLQIYKSVN